MPESAHEKTISGESRQIVGAATENLAIGSLDGEFNVAEIGQWIEAMRERQARQKFIDEWVKIVRDLGEAGRAWLRINREWASEIAVRFNQEPANVALYVVAKNADAITVERRRDVADMGLLMGGGFGVRAEARITTSRPENHTFILA